MERCLVIVTRDQPELWRDLMMNFAQAEGVEVILDRRQTERWQRDDISESPAERAERRRHSSFGTDLHGRNFVVVPQP